VRSILEPNEITRALPCKKVTGYDFRDGRIELRHPGLTLPYRTSGRITRVDQGASVENKRLGSLLEMIKAYQDSQPQEQPSRKAPKRRD
jgi:hypothetical protein